MEKQNYFWKNYSRPVLFSLSPWKKQINIYWNFKESAKISKNLANMLQRWGVEVENKGHLGVGGWRFPVIKNDNGLQNLKEFILEYKNYCGSEPKTD